jgi:rhamnosyltransferase
MEVEKLEELRKQVETLVVVDNGSCRVALEILRTLSRSADVVLIENGVNLGIAAALNAGVRWALAHEQRWVLLLDQDSTITDGFVKSMLADFEKVAGRKNVMQLIPRYRDPDTGDEAVISVAPDGGPFITPTSGSFFPIETFIKCGLFTEELFIYCVDDDFSLRLRSMGFSIAQSQKAILLHQGGRPSRFTFLGKTFTTRNYRPEVQYYWARNRVWLIRKYGLRYPLLILSSLRSLFGIPLKIAIAEKNRCDKIRMFMRGALDGVRGKSGRRVDIV